MEDKFDKIYQEIYEENNKIIADMKRKRNKKILIIFAILLVIDFVIGFIAREKTFIIMSIVISVIILMFLLIIEHSKFTKFFKQNIIQTIIKKCNPKLNFTYDSGVSKHEYMLSEFDNSFDEFFSEDRIHGFLDNNINFQMSQVVTKEITKQIDNNGNERTTRTETFRGIYGIVRLNKSINSKILISNNSIIKKYSSTRVEMDSAEFETEYDCLTKNRILAMKIFTSDLLEKFVDLKNVKLSKILFKIEDDMIYFRIACGEVFEPPMFKDCLNKDIIKKYFNTIFFPVEIIEKTVEKMEML